MQLNNIHGFDNIADYVRWKVGEYSKEEKSFKTLFKYMFSERENIMAEISSGHRIRKISYGDFSDDIISIAPSVAKKLTNVPQGSIVGLYMENTVAWIKMFWCILMCGYTPLLMNLRLSDEILIKILNDHSVAAVITDGKEFSGITNVHADEISADYDATFLDLEWGREILFMSSGTTNNVKLCAYTGENLYYQICNSIDIIKKCPAITEHYKGELKQLTLLPFYHVFGFIAVYIWFGFFSRTFVFLKDLQPQTLLNTVKKHKVTHIFAVPLVWDTIYREAMKQISARGEKTLEKFKKALSLANSLGALGALISKMAFTEVRENIFGDSIRFMISGGSHINAKVLEFFNGIGYHLANGYGMTEIGITSLEVSDKRKTRNLASIGAPFEYTQYTVSDSGELLVRGWTMASRIIQGVSVTETDFDKWFNTRDLVSFRNDRYYIEGRMDDLIVCENGENINPTLVEEKLRAEGCDSVCLFADSENLPTLIVGIPVCFSTEALKKSFDKVTVAIQRANLDGIIKRVVVTTDPLISGSEFKISRKRVAERYARGCFKIISTEISEEQISVFVSELEQEVCECFAKALGRDATDISPTATFFLDLGGSSLDYFYLLSILKQKYGISLPDNEKERLYTARDFCNYITKK
ncbi:MAG: AMP-binding protein [Clostridia bacterium]|nr:AMP-binding protein [Clostridia bacterium]